MTSGYQFKHQSSTPDAPASSHTRLFAKDDKGLYSQDTTGEVAPAGYVTGTVQTTNATATDCVVVSVADSSFFKLKVECLGLKNDNSAALWGNIEGVFYRSGGNVTQIGSTTNLLVENSGSSPTVGFTLDTANQEVEIEVTGVVAETWDWKLFVQRFDL